MRSRQLSVYAKQLLSCILLFSTVVLFPGHSQARDLDPGAWPLSSIGRVNVVLGAGRFMHCTGALIGPKHVLTAAHCLYDKIRETSVRPSSVHFLAGYSRGDFIGHSQALSYQIGTQFAADGRRITWAPDDWAIVELLNSLDLKPIKIQHHSAPSGIAHYIRAGYRNDRAHLLTIQSDCTVEAETSSRLLLIYGCNAAPGESGSAIIEIGSGSEPEIIGILVASSQREAQHAFAVPSSTFESVAVRALKQLSDPPWVAWLGTHSASGRVNPPSTAEPPRGRLRSWSEKLPRYSRAFSLAAPRTPVALSDLAALAPVGHRQPQISDLPRDLQRAEQDRAAVQATPSERTKVSKSQGSSRARGHSAVPAFDVKRSCQAMEAAALSLGGSGPSRPSVESCINSEEAAREQLQNRWTGFSVAKRVECVGITNIGGLPSYIEVLSCLELAQALEMMRATTPAGP